MKKLLERTKLYIEMGLNYMIMGIDFVLDFITTENVVKFRTQLENIKKHIEYLKGLLKKEDK